jgi:hypothetical protein
MHCPVCSSINTGKVGNDTYYCSNCLLEFDFVGGQYQIYYIDDEGVSYALKDTGEAKMLSESFQNGDEMLFQERLEELISKS